MSLLKWKEMAEKQSKVGQDVNTVREALKQKKITDSMSDIQAEKLLKPITSELKEITAPQPVRKRLPTKKRQVPDYAIPVEDEVPDYGLEDLFGESAELQETKPIPPKPPSYEDLEAIAELSLPPEYDEDDVPDYEILEEDKIDQILDKLGIANYEDIQDQLQKETTQETKYNMLSEKIQEADKKRQ